MQVLFECHASFGEMCHAQSSLAEVLSADEHLLGLLRTTNYKRAETLCTYLNGQFLILDTKA